MNIHAINVGSGSGSANVSRIATPVASSTTTSTGALFQSNSNTDKTISTNSTTVISASTAAQPSITKSIFSYFSGVGAGIVKHTDATLPTTSSSSNRGSRSNTLDDTNPAYLPSITSTTTVAYSGTVIEGDQDVEVQVLASTESKSKTSTPTSASNRTSQSRMTLAPL